MQTLITNKTLARMLVISVLIFVLFIGGFVKNTFFPTFHHVTYSTGFVTDKYQEKINNTTQNFIVMKFKENILADIPNTIIIVEDSKNWDNIQINNAYYVCYEWINKETPKLVLFQLNTDFMEIYDINFQTK